MKKIRNNRYFISNYWLVSYLFASGIFTCIICITFIMTNLPLWTILFSGLISLCLILIGIFTLFFLRCQISKNGIIVIKGCKQKLFLSWNDINTVKVTCSKGIMRYHTAYIIELNGFIKIKTYNEIAIAIEEYSNGCETFHSLYTQSLEKAEESC